jgi:hypothetical protein
MAQTQTPFIKQIYVTYNGQGIIVSADIQSKSRPNITHYTRVIINPISMRIYKASCDCEGFTHRRKCWHIEALKQEISNIREEIEKVKEESSHDDIASWG